MLNLEKKKLFIFGLLNFFNRFTMGVCAIKYVSNINKLSYFIKGAFTFVFWT